MCLSGSFRREEIRQSVGQDIVAAAADQPRLAQVRGRALERERKRPPVMFQSACRVRRQTQPQGPRPRQGSWQMPAEQGFAQRDLRSHSRQHPMHYAERMYLQIVQTLWSSKPYGQLQPGVQLLSRFLERRHTGDIFSCTLSAGFPGMQKCNRAAERCNRKNFLHRPPHDLATNLGE